MVVKNPERCTYLLLGFHQRQHLAKLHYNITARLLTLMQSNDLIQDSCFSYTRVCVCVSYATLSCVEVHLSTGTAEVYNGSITTNAHGFLINFLKWSALGGPQSKLSFCLCSGSRCIYRRRPGTSPTPARGSSSSARGSATGTEQLAIRDGAKEKGRAGGGGRRGVGRDEEEEGQRGED